MDITCPQCGFSREIPDEQIPPTAKKATCPKCGTKFSFREENLEFLIEPEEAVTEQQSPAPEETAAPQAVEEAPAAPPEEESVSPAAETEQEEERPVAPWIRKAEEAKDNAGQERKDDIWQRLEDMDTPEASRHARRERIQNYGKPFEEQRPEVEVPWERLDKYGFFGGLGQTIKRVLLSPRLFFESMPRTGSLTRPLAFFLLLSLFGSLINTLWVQQFFGSLIETIQDPTLQDIYSKIAGSPSNILRNLLITPFLDTLFIFFLTSVFHLSLVLTGSGKSGFVCTFRVFAYAWAPVLMYILPFVGIPVGWVWISALLVIGLMRTHESPFWRVALALLLPVLILILTAQITVSSLPNMV